MLLLAVRSKTPAYSPITPDRHKPNTSTSETPVPVEKVKERNTGCLEPAALLLRVVPARAEAVWSPMATSHSNPRRWEWGEEALITQQCSL